ncbi:hypothetical protein AVEN_200179-1 [Araneus ventricosus]|uniref:Ubiquitin-like protease family profile domain-containing protein n=1 Tax=Araneus ventricosus TaxID=182803 RepID=A0A4Y2MES2_ARAVE|nr:hypothetical protein AVEN_200179-1 [Araneus ventricosus]
MFGDDILRFFSMWADLNGVFQGVFPADNIPLLTGKAAIIVNTDVSGGHGKHWVALFMESDKLDFFDSFGKSPDEFLNGSFHTSCFAEKFPNTTYNPIKFQSRESLVCGYYSIYFILQRYQGYNFNDILKILMEHEDTDKYVKNFIENNFPT